MNKDKIKKFKQRIVKCETVGVDSMLFSYYFYGKAPYADLAEIIIERCAEKKLVINTSIISYLEPLSYPELEMDIDRKNYVKNFFVNQENLKIRNLDIKLADEAGRIRRVYNLSAPDAIQFSSSIIDKTQVFITNDKHFNKLAGKEKIEILFLDDYIN